MTDMVLPDLVKQLMNTPGVFDVQVELVSYKTVPMRYGANAYVNVEVPKFRVHFSMYQEVKDD